MVASAVSTVANKLWSHTTMNTVTPKIAGMRAKTLKRIPSSAPTIAAMIAKVNMIRPLGK
jgi:hypothetical protein